LYGNPASPWWVLAPLVSPSFRILIADDHEVVRRGIRSLFELRPDYEICGEAVDGHDAVAKAKQLKHDLILLDIGMPGLNGLDAARILGKELPEAAVIIVSQHEAAHMRLQALETGACGYVAKSDLARDLLTAVDRIVAIRRPGSLESTDRGTPADKQSVARRAMLAGGGEMGRLMRAKDWSRTRLGPVELWPQSLKTSVSTCLNSRFPILIWWGPDLVMLYNDAYRQIIGSKHPQALGNPGQECWYEIWDTIGPMLEKVLGRGEATWSDDLLLLLHRHGYPEECYFTFSYSPIRDESGAVGGVFTPVAETTDKVIGERRLRTLRDLAARVVEKTCEAETWRSAGEVLAQNPYDISFAVVYRLHESSTKASGVVRVGIGNEDSFFPAEIEDLQESGVVASWISQAMLSGAMVEVPKAGEHGFNLPIGHWGVAPQELVVLPLTKSSQEQPLGVLLAGVNPMKLLDESYRTFFSLVAGQLAKGVAEIEAYEQERNRVAALQLAHDDLEGRVKERTIELERAERGLRALSSRLLQSQDDERRRIARELHDSAGQLLTALSMNLIPLEQKLEKSGPEQLKPVRESIALVEELSKELRTISHLLHPPLLDEAGLPSALRWYVGGFAERSKIPVKLELAPNLGRLTRELETTIFRVVQECLTNIHRHSESPTASICFTRDARNVRVEICDRGKGMPRSGYESTPGPVRPGVGIQGMRERVRQMGGTLDIHSNKQGTRVVVTLPAMGASAEDSGLAELVS